MSEVTPEQEAAIRERAAEFMAERPDEPEWSSRRRGETYFTAAYDRRVLLAALDATREDRDRLRTALEKIAGDLDDADRLAIKASRLRTIARTALERSP